MSYKYKAMQDASRVAREILGMTVVSAEVTWVSSLSWETDSTLPASVQVREHEGWLTLAWGTTPLRAVEMIGNLWKDLNENGRTFFCFDSPESRFICQRLNEKGLVLTLFKYPGTETRFIGHRISAVKHFQRDSVKVRLGENLAPNEQLAEALCDREAVPARAKYINGRWRLTDLHLERQADIVRLDDGRVVKHRYRVPDDASVF